MADASVAHHDRIADQFRTEGVAIPVDRGTGVGHRQVWQRGGGAGGVPGLVRLLVQFGNCCRGAAHGDSSGVRG